MHEYRARATQSDTETASKERQRVWVRRGPLLTCAHIQPALATGTIISTLSGLCVSIIGGAVNGTNVQLGTCTSGDAKQQWSIDSSTGLITNKATSLCLDAGTP